ncbi:MAG: hypothetical protein AcusKO_07150 [Acuticoccus sp.]
MAARAAKPLRSTHAKDHANRLPKGTDPQAPSPGGWKSVDADRGKRKSGHQGQERRQKPAAKKKKKRPPVPKKKTTAKAKTTQKAAGDGEGQAQEKTGGGLSASPPLQRGESPATADDRACQSVQRPTDDRNIACPRLGQGRARGIASPHRKDEPANGRAPGLGEACRWPSSSVGGAGGGSVLAACRVT